VPWLTIATRIAESSPGRGEDRIAVLESIGHRTILVADGAGGVSGGAAAAEYLCRSLTGDTLHEARDWSDWLAQCDAALAARSTGLAAAVVLSMAASGEIRGASVGDCEAWLFAGGEPVNLTAQQVRKPLLGDGAAIPVSFRARVAHGTIVIASDGLWKYVGLAGIAKAAALRPLEAALEALVGSARLRSGALQDDVAIVVCECRQ
jgi:serine/threonine protein phosphatase PrpC